MTKVDFYILSSGSTEHTTCKLVEKAYNMGHRVYIHTESDAQTNQIDALLWTYRAGSFIPHQRYQAGSEKDSPVINMAPEVPLFFSRFERVAELIDNNEEHKKLGRERYRFYKDRGYPLDTHNL